MFKIFAKIHAVCLIDPHMIFLIIFLSKWLRYYTILEKLVSANSASEVVVKIYLKLKLFYFHYGLVIGCICKCDLVATK